MAQDEELFRINLLSCASAQGRLGSRLDPLESGSAARIGCPTCEFCCCSQAVCSFAHKTLFL